MGLGREFFSVNSMALAAGKYTSKSAENKELRSYNPYFFTKFTLVEGYAHKKGEVVGLAGGETGVPHCLAEVRKLPRVAAIYCFDRVKTLMAPQKHVK